MLKVRKEFGLLKILTKKYIVKKKKLTRKKYFVCISLLCSAEQAYITGMHDHKVIAQLVLGLSFATIDI